MDLLTPIKWILYAFWCIIVFCGISYGALFLLTAIF